MRCRLPLLAALSIVAALGLSARAGAPQPAASVAIDIVDYAFQPSTQTIVQGDTVTWTNTGEVNHAVASNTESWDYVVIPPKSTFAVTFTDAGIFPYSCAIHPSMEGTIYVVPPTPTATHITAPAFLPMVSNPPTPTGTPTATATPLPVGVVPNGNFELGQVAWYEFSEFPYDVITTVFPKSVRPHSGVWAAWMGGVLADSGVTYTGVEQDVHVSASKPYLSYWQWIASADMCGYDFGVVTVNLDTVVDQVDLCTAKNTGGWKRRTINLSAYAGQDVLLSIYAETDSTYNSNWFVDDVTFQSRAAVNDEASPDSDDPQLARPRS